MKTKTIFWILVFLPFIVLSQNIQGEFSQLSNQPVKLIGFDNFETYVIDSTTTDVQGKFSLDFSSKDHGMGYLKSTAEQPLILALDKSEIILKGTDFKAIEDFTVEKGEESRWFYTYAIAHPKREQALSAWLFLEKKYEEEELFQSHMAAKKAIDIEISHLKAENEQFIADLPEDSYMKWYLPLRSLLSSVGNVAQNIPERIPETLQQLRAIDYTEEKLDKSGLFYDAIFNHIWFIENSSGPLEQVFKDLNLSIDIIAEQLKGHDERFNLVMEKMFEILEERSLFTSSEYLAEKLLNSDDCGCLNPQLQKKLERYGKLAQGQTAPDILFTKFTYFPEGVSAKSLKDINAGYKLVVFAAGWCPHCRETMPKIVAKYEDWKNKGVEVVFVSLDETPQDFAKFAGPLPFISTTDYKKWEGQAVQDYQVYATPSYFMLDKNLKILIRPKSVEHIQSWIEFNVK
jgi:thiol-disulfide isomerase/thioredoxin